MASPGVAALWGLLLVLVPLQATAELWGVRWRGPADLAALAANGIVPRYVAPSLSLVEAEAEAMAALVADEGVEIVFRDQAGPDEAYYLTDHLQVPLDPRVEAVFRDFSGWALLRVPDEARARVQDRQHFLWPLPQAYDLRGWQRYRGQAKSASPLQDAAVEAIVGRVDAGVLEEHVRRLALQDPDGGDGRENWRTRFARRDETFESTLYIRDQLAAVLGAENVEIQEFRRAEDEPPMYNVVGTLPGSDPDAGYYVVCAHYDAVGTRTRQGWDGATDPAPGADDNASGTALVLESGRPASAVVGAFHRLFGRRAGAMGLVALRPGGAGARRPGLGGAQL